jgi:hypothetical protein
MKGRENAEWYTGSFIEIPSQLEAGKQWTVGGLRMASAQASVVRPVGVHLFFPGPQTSFHVSDPSSSFVVIS